MARRDDDALSWGDDDPTLDTGAGGSRRDDPADVHERATDVSAPALPEGYTAVGRGSEATVPATTARADQGRDGAGANAAASDSSVDAPQLGNVALVAMGMVSAAYLLFAVGWLIAGLRLQAVTGLPVPGPTLAAMTIGAALAPVIWLGTVILLTRRSRIWLRFVWLVAGLVLLVPWPFLATGGGA